ncbi:PQQ-binding-like beta-propeller repeat protein [Candidatus Latescibacterota bacterium]
MNVISAGKISTLLLCLFLLIPSLSFAGGGSWTYYYDTEGYSLSQTTVSGDDVISKVNETKSGNGAVMIHLDSQTNVINSFFPRNISVNTDSPNLIFKSNEGNFMLWGYGRASYVSPSTTFNLYSFKPETASFSTNSTAYDLFPYYIDSFGHTFGTYPSRSHSSAGAGGVYILSNGDIFQPEDPFWKAIVVSSDRTLWAKKNDYLMYAPVSKAVSGIAEWVETSLDLDITIGSEGPDGAMYFGGPETGICRVADGEWEKIVFDNITESVTVTDFWYEAGSALWISTPEALVRFDGETWESFTTTQGGYTFNNIDVSGGTVWAGTTNGLVCFRYGDLSGDTAIGDTKENVNAPSFKTFDTGASIISSPSIDNDGGILIGNSKGTLYAINPDLTEKWSAAFEATITSTPVIADDGSIYITIGKELYRLIAGGDVAWKQQTDSGNYGGKSIDSSPSIGNDGDIYVGNSGAYGRSLNRFNTYSALVWRQDLPGYAASSPAITGDNTVIIGSTENGYYEGYYHDVGMSVHGFPQNGIDSPSTYKTQGNVYSSPAIGKNGIFYIGSEDGFLRAFSLTGSMIWSYDTGQMIHSSAAVGADGSIYFGCYDNSMYALGPNGSLKWSYRAGDVIFSSPAIDSNGVIYFGSKDSFIYALNPDGTLKWRFKTDGPVDSSPVIAEDGTLYIGSGDGKLYAFDTGSKGLQADSPWPCFKHDSKRTGRTTEIMSRYNLIGKIFDNGVPHYNAFVTYDSGSGKTGAGYTSSDGWLVFENMYPGTYQMTANRNDTNFFPYRFTVVVNDSDVNFGNLDISEFPLKNYFYSPTRIKNSMLYDGTIYCLDTIYPNTTVHNSVVYKIMSVNAYSDDLEFLWEFPLGETLQYYHSAIGNDGTIYASTTEALYAITPQGTLKWKIDTEGIYQFAIGSDKTLYASCQDLKLRAINNLDGSILYSTPLNEWYQLPPVIGSDGTIYIMEGTSKASCFTSTGTQKWSVDIPINTKYDLTPRMALNHTDVLYVYGPAYGVVAISPEGGTPVLKDLPGGLTSNLVIDRDGILYFNSEDSLIAKKPDGYSKWSLNIFPHNLPSENLIETISLGENAIYATLTDASVMAVNYDGTLEWTEPAGSGDTPIYPILRSDGLAFMGDYRYLLKVDINEQGFQKGAPWPYANHDPRNSFNVRTPFDTAVEDSDSKPVEYITAAAYPNPFNPSTTISFTLPEKDHANLSVYSITGQVIATLVDEKLSRGIHNVKFEAKELSSGVYFYRLVTGSGMASGKILLLR